MNYDVSSSLIYALRDLTSQLTANKSDNTNRLILEELKKMTQAVNENSKLLKEILEKDVKKSSSTTISLRARD